MRMRCFLFLTAFLPIAPTVAEVVYSVSNCSGFLLKEKLPEIKNILEKNEIKDQNRYKLICQTYNNKKRFLTVYDTMNKIPVFSAYKFKEITTGRRPNSCWMIEPQLSEDQNENNKNMKPSTEESYANQASFNDYDNAQDKSCNKGHLYPNGHAPEKEDKMSTFTLTNIVPQAIKFNGGSWSRMENCIRCVMEKLCIDNNQKIEGFVVTGAQSSNENKLESNVNIPDKLWSAFCCYNSIKEEWLAGAHWGDNKEPAETFLPPKTVRELKEELGIDVFPEQEKILNFKVVDLYKNFEKKCQCPPQ